MATHTHTCTCTQETHIQREQTPTHPLETCGTSHSLPLLVAMVELYLVYVYGGDIWLKSKLHCCFSIGCS
jgi:hypothetical protein